jgi:hypothetical protein
MPRMIACRVASRLHAADNDTRTGTILEVKMGNVFVALTFTATTLASPVLAATTCLDIHEIVDTRSDGKIMEFRMRDGQTYINHLQGSCSTLKYYSFVWTVHGMGQICEYVQSLQVLNTGQVCTLGKFDPPADRSPSVGEPVTKLADRSQ